MAGDNTERRIAAAERTMEVPPLPAATQGQVLEIRDRLRAVRDTMSPEQFNQWAAAEIRMDEATAQDFLAFEATDPLTPRLWEYFERMARDATG